MAGAVTPPTMLSEGIKLPRINEEARRIFHAIKTRDDQDRRQLTRIHDRHREIARLVALGMTDSEVAAQVGVNPAWVSTVRNTDIVNDQIATLREERDEKLMAARTAMEDAAAEVAEFLRDTALDTELHPKYRLQAAESILDRVGLGKTSKTESHSTVEHYSTIENIRRLAANTAPNPNIKPLEAIFEPLPAAGDAGEAEGRTIGVPPAASSVDGGRTTAVLSAAIKPSTTLDPNAVLDALTAAEAANDTNS